MTTLPRSLSAWGSADFQTVLKAEIEALPTDQLPLQAGLARSSYVTGSPHTAIILGSTEEAGAIRAKVGLFYAGIIAGCSCADDPTPIEEQTEYCEVEIELDRASGEATIRLLDD